MSHFAYFSEENYVKALYKLEQRSAKKITNSALAKVLELNPATVLEMVRKMEQRSLVQILPDKSIRLSEKGKQKALLTIRRHRLWEVFLVNKLKFNWNEVHDLAEQLEHIDSEDLVNRLEDFLGYPAFDPHGDPIPDKQGVLRNHESHPLTTCEIGRIYTVQHFAETSDAFLLYLDQVQILPGTRVKINGINAYDQSFSLVINNQNVQVSEKVAANILVVPV